jgi:hypothetical protein
MPIAITPAQLRARRRKDIPQWVIDVVNELLVENCNSRTYCIIHQDSIIDAILEREPGLVRSDVFKHGYLDFEEIFAEAGWRVQYYKQFGIPSYFEFSPVGD